MSFSDILEINGFVQIPGLLSPALCQKFIDLVGNQDGQGAGTRKLLELYEIHELANGMLKNKKLDGILNNHHIPVSCTLFDKNLNKNWQVPFHRDEFVQFESPVYSNNYSEWTLKEGIHCAKPSRNILNKLVAIRLALDDNSLDNGPLRLIPGSHVWPSEREYFKSDEIYSACLNAGDILVMNPLALHASSKISSGSRRRVLHFVFGPSELPDGAHWLKYGAPNESLHRTAK